MRKKQKPTCFVIAGPNGAGKTTLAGRSQINLLKKVRQDGWKIIQFFLWIPNAAFSKSPIRERVKHGGHDIPDDTIFRRFLRIMHNLVNIYIPLCDKVVCYDNSESEPVIIFAQDKNGQKISNNDIYEKIVRCANGCKRNP